MTSSPFILLATYNGAAYLPEMLESLRRQTCQAWRLLVRDDGSTDATSAILAEAAQHDSRIELVHDDLGRQGPAHNFGVLMGRAQEAGAAYVFFADQDDVWLPHKIERQLQAMHDLEARLGRDLPLLVHSDLRVVDRRLKLIHPSLKTFAAMHRDDADPQAGLLVGNHVTGCATLVNRALLDAALPLPEKIVMHDWWVAQCAVMLGSIRFLPQAMLLYRLHGGNTVGAESMWRKLNVLRFDSVQRWRHGVQEFALGLEQIRALHRRLGERTKNPRHPAARFVAAYLRAVDAPASVWQRWQKLRGVGYRRASYLRQAVLAARLWSLPSRLAG